MKKIRFFIGLALTMTMLVVQVGAVLASPDTQNPSVITGTVQSITIEKDASTGITTVLVTVMNSDAVSQTLRISLKTAVGLGLVALDGDGNPVINNSALGQPIEIDPATVIINNEAVQHPVGSALAKVFSDVIGVDYDIIMTAHDQGFGFGVIAQALWMTKRLGENSEFFIAILEARNSGDYSAFTLPDGTIPMNWGQFKKAVMESKKDNLGVIMSGRDKGNSNSVNRNGKENNNGNNNSNGNGKGKEKKK